MIRLLLALIVLTTFTASAQTVDTIGIKHKKEKYYLTKTCYDFLYWDEAILRDKSMESKINSVIRGAVNRFKLKNNSDDAESRCHQQMDYESTFKIVYAKHNLISYVLTAHTYFKGAVHGYREFRTINFNTNTGEQINFHDFIDSSKINPVNTIIRQKFRNQYGVEDDTYFDAWKASMEEQLNSLYFELCDNGIIIQFIGTNYASSVLDVFLTYEELDPYVNKQGLLKAFYRNGIMNNGR